MQAPAGVSDNSAVLDNLVALFGEMFTKAHMDKDEFMLANMQPNMTFPIGVICRNPIVRQITTEDSLVERALSLSPSVEVFHGVVRPRLKVEQHTVILRDIPESTDVAVIMKLFEDAQSPRVTSARPDMNNTWFVSFSTEDDARQALAGLRKCQFEGSPIKARLKTESLNKSFYGGTGFGGLTPTAAGALPSPQAPLGSPVMAQPDYYGNPANSPQHMQMMMQHGMYFPFPIPPPGSYLHPQGLPYSHLSPIGGVPGAWPVNPGGPPPPRGMFTQQLQQQRQNKGGMGPGRGGQYKQQFRSSPRNNMQGGGGFAPNRSALGAADGSAAGGQESVEGILPADGPTAAGLPREGEGVRRTGGAEPLAGSGVAEGTTNRAGQGASGQFNRRGGAQQQHGQGQPYQGTGAGAATGSRSGRAPSVPEQAGDDEANQRKRQSAAATSGSAQGAAGASSDKQGGAAAQKKKDAKRSGNKAGGDGEGAVQSGAAQQTQKTSPSGGVKAGSNATAGSDQKRSPRGGDAKSKKSGGRQGVGGADKRNIPGFNLDDADFPTWAENSVGAEKSPSGGLGNGVEKGSWAAALLGAGKRGAPSQDTESFSADPVQASSNSTTKVLSPQPVAAAPHPILIHPDGSSHHGGIHSVGHISFGCDAKDEPSHIHRVPTPIPSADEVLQRWTDEASGSAASPPPLHVNDSPSERKKQLSSGTHVNHEIETFVFGSFEAPVEDNTIANSRQSPLDGATAKTSAKSVQASAAAAEGSASSGGTEARNGSGGETAAASGGKRSFMDVLKAKK